jgi:hypothetical protein
MAKKGVFADEKGEVSGIEFALPDISLMTSWIRAPPA